jgi:hypothetical protein
MITVVASQSKLTKDIGFEQDVFAGMAIIAGLIKNNENPRKGKAMGTQ